MEKQSTITHKDLWNNILPFIGMNDYFNLEICNRNFRSILQNHYLLQTNHLKDSSFPKSPKKTFFSIYKNSIVILNGDEEFNTLEESEEFKISNQDSSEKIKPKRERVNSQTICSTQKCQENTIFSQE